MTVNMPLDEETKPGHLLVVRGLTLLKGIMSEDEQSASSDKEIRLFLWRCRLFKI